MPHVKWLGKAVHPERRFACVARAVSELRPHNFDSIACQGTSGIWFGTLLAYKLNKHLVIVRKPDEGRQVFSKKLLDHKVEALTIGNYLLVDDLISTGTTLRRIIAEIGLGGNPIGVYLYELQDGIDEDVEWVSKEMGELVNLPLLNPRVQVPVA